MLFKFGAKLMKFYTTAKSFEYTFYTPFSHIGENVDYELQL